MANYKGLKFSNNLQEFKRWTKEFEPLERGTSNVFYQDGDCYCSIETVKGTPGGGSFAGVTIRKYNHDERDFELQYDEDYEIAEELFKDKINRYKKKHNLKY